MKKKKFSPSIFLGMLFILCVSGKRPQPVTIWLMGDSTVCDQPLDRAPVTGWGSPFAGYFDSTVTVKNRARGGRSTRTFISEGRWQAIADSLQAGDYLLIQFGHNDEASEPQYRDRYTPVPDFKKNLEAFIRVARLRQAHPILLTPVTRMRFDAQGHAQPTHVLYSAAVNEVARQLKVPVIDLDSLSRSLLEGLGPETSRLLFMQLEPGQNPHYLKGRRDNTHFSETGARMMAELVLNEIKRQELSLADRITKKQAP